MQRFVDRYKNIVHFKVMAAVTLWRFAFILTVGAYLETVISLLLRSYRSTSSQCSHRSTISDAVIGSIPTVEWREDDHPIDNNDDVININIDSPSVSTILDKLRDKSVLILGNTLSALLSIL